MQINEDCIRDVLGYIIKNVNYRKEKDKYYVIEVSDIFPVNKSITERCKICEVTYVGHNFYSTIQPESIWKKTKSIIGKIGNHTLSFIETVAHDVAIESAKQAITITMMK